MGITGDDLGFVTGNGINPELFPTDNWAMIFDATCGGAPPCSGGDDD